ncbi:E3 ubiquitin-protein ligase ATL6 [Morella rubra]|nr:E3 ubiquitin-protein ligase ATL6 [Morella rubra]
MPGYSSVRLIIPCLILLFLLPVYPLANAQSTTESAPGFYQPGANFNQSMAVIVVFLMCAFFFMAFFSIYIRECVESRAATLQTAGGPANVGNRSRQRGLDRAVIDTFPILVYSAVRDLKIGKGGLECAVCLSEFEDHETLRLLPKCQHAFHPDCIDAWLTSHITCPVCRAKLTPEELRRKAAQSNDSGGESSQEITTSEPVGVQSDHILIDVIDDHSTVEIVNRPTTTTVSGKFPRSHSTGHSLVQPGESTERYTLRLPEEVRKQILATGLKLRRSSSYDVVLGRVWSSRKGYRSGGDGEGSSRGKSSSVNRQVGRSDWWVYSMTPTKGGSVKSPKLGGEGNATNGKNFLTPVRDAVRFSLA